MHHCLFTLCVLVQRHYLCCIKLYLFVLNRIKLVRVSAPLIYATDTFKHTFHVVSGSPDIACPLIKAVTSEHLVDFLSAFAEKMEVCFRRCVLDLQESEQIVHCFAVFLPALSLTVYSALSEIAYAGV